MVAIDQRQTATPRADGTPVPDDGKLSIYVKVFLISLLIPIGFNLGGIALDVLRVVQILIIVPLFIQLISGKAGKLILVDYMFVAHILWVCVALFVNNPDRALENAGITSIEFASAYIVGRVCIRSKAQFIRLCKWVGFLVIATLPLALLESQTGRPIILDTIRSAGFRSHYDVYHPPRAGLWRAQVVFIHPIHYGLFCSAALPLVFVALRHTMAMVPRLAITALVGLCCFLSLSSGAILAVVLQVMLVSWAFVFRNVERRWLYLTILFAVIYVVIDLLSNRAPLQVFMSYATFSSHTAYWRSIILEWGLMNIFGNEENNVPGNPIFGLGFRDWVRPHFMYSGSMDNFWLVLAVRYGLPALFFFFVGYVVTLFRIGYRDFSADPELTNLRRGWMFLFVGLSFTLATVHIWSAMYAYTIFLFGSGIWMLTAQPEDENATPSTPSPTQTRHPPYTRFAKDNASAPAGRQTAYTRSNLS